MNTLSIYELVKVCDNDNIGSNTLEFELCQDSLMAEIIIRGHDIDISIEYDPGYLDDVDAQSLVDKCSKALMEFLRLPL